MFCNIAQWLVDDHQKLRRNKRRDAREAIMTGQCKLCLQHKNLQKSHFLPAGIYRILRDEKEKNPNPWAISKKRTVQTSRQRTAYLLCQDCEQRFSKHGENWVLRHCLQRDGRHPLASILASKTPDRSTPEIPTRVYYASNIHEISVPKLAYFAASIFWRGSIHPWNNDGSIPSRLGPFQEQFRQYLMGLQPFPKDCSLWLAIREGKEINGLTFAPVSQREGNFHVCKFPMPGLAFTLLTGKNIPANYREMCFVRGSGNPVIVTTVIENSLMKLAKSYSKE